MEERESKISRKMARVKERRGALSFFGSRFISLAAKSAKPKIPYRRSFFAPTPNGNACYAAYVKIPDVTVLLKREIFSRGQQPFPLYPKESLPFLEGSEALSFAFNFRLSLPLL